jgi:hypothetical protein
LRDRHRKQNSHASRLGAKRNQPLETASPTGFQGLEKQSKAGQMPSLEIDEASIAYFFLWRSARRRLRRLWFDILVLRHFLMVPMFSPNCFLKGQVR